MEDLKIGVIGCGAASMWHVGTMLGTSGVQVVALTDPNEANLDRMKQRIPAVGNTPTFASPDEMYAAMELDGVVVVTPHTLHYPQIMQAVEQGIHVMCEKPMVCEPQHARDIQAACETTGAVAMVNYQRRYYAPYMYMRETIQSGKLRELRAISVQCGQRWKKGTAGLWRQNPDLSGGGMLMDSGSHLLDMLLWLVGRPIESVYATVDNLGTPVDINTNAIVNFEGGVQGQVAVLGDLEGVWIEHVLVSGTGGTLWYEIEPQNPWGVGRVFHDHEGRIEQPTNIHGGIGTARAWVETIRGNMENPAPPDAAHAVAELTSLMYRSAREGTVVQGLTVS